MNFWSNFLDSVKIKIYHDFARFSQMLILTKSKMLDQKSRFFKNSLETISEHVRSVSSRWTCLEVLLIQQLDTTNINFLTQIYVMGEVHFLPFSKCVSEKLLWLFSVKLHSIEAPTHSTNWQSISFCTHFYTTSHDLWTWS